MSLNIQYFWYVERHHINFVNLSSGKKDRCLQPRFGFIMSWEGTWREGNELLKKNRFFELSRARCAFGARKTFETTVDHIQNFCIWQIFLNLLYWLYSKKWVWLPPSPIGFQDNIFVKRYVSYNLVIYFLWFKK